MMEIAGTDQGGLGLPDRDYYLKTDDKSVELRKQYVAHVAKMFELMGEKPDQAAADAKTVMKIETALATGFAGPRRAARSQQDVPQDDHRRACRTSAPTSPGTSTSRPSKGPRSPASTCRSPTSSRA